MRVRLTLLSLLVAATRAAAQPVPPPAPRGTPRRVPEVRVITDIRERFGGGVPEEWGRCAAVFGHAYRWSLLLADPERAIHRVEILRGRGVVGPQIATIERIEDPDLAARWREAVVAEIPPAWGRAAGLTVEGAVWALFFVDDKGDSAPTARERPKYEGTIRRVAFKGAARARAPVDRYDRSGPRRADGVVLWATIPRRFGRLVGVLPEATPKSKRSSGVLGSFVFAVAGGEIRRAPILRSAETVRGRSIGRLGAPVTKRGQVSRVELLNRVPRKVLSSLQERVIARIPRHWGGPIAAAGEDPARWSMLLEAGDGTLRVLSFARNRPSSRVLVVRRRVPARRLPEKVWPTYWETEVVFPRAWGKAILIWGKAGTTSPGLGMVPFLEDKDGAIRFAYQQSVIDYSDPFSGTSWWFRWDHVIRRL